MLSFSILTKRYLIFFMINMIRACRGLRHWSAVDLNSLVHILAGSNRYCGGHLCYDASWIIFVVE